MCECFVLFEAVPETYLLSTSSFKPSAEHLVVESFRAYVGFQNVLVLFDPALFESFALTDLCALLAHSFLP